MALDCLASRTVLSTMSNSLLRIRRAAVPCTLVDMGSPMLDKNKRHEGGCFCGSVRYAVGGSSVWKAGCCCRSCVKMHGAPYVVWAGFERAAFELVQGEPLPFKCSPHVIRRFCPRCGTTLTYEKDAQGYPALEEAAGVIYVAVATLHHPEVYPPDEVVHAGERIEWLDLGNKIPLRESLSAQAGHLQFAGLRGDK